MSGDIFDVESKLGPHYALLFKGTRCQLNPRDCQEIRRANQAGVDWCLVLDLARRYNVLSLLYYHLRRPHFKDIIPGEILVELKNEYAAICGLNLAYYQELNRLIKLFSEYKIEITLLKGAALARLVYPDIGLRAFADMDLLVRPEQLGQIDEIMQPDYQLNCPLPNTQLARDCYFHLNYGRRRSPALNFEFHWNLYSAEDLISFDTTRFWQDGNYIELSTEKVLIPSPENLFLHLCLHFSGHWFLALKDLWDVEWMVSSPNYTLNWNKIVALAKDSGLHVRVYYALSFARRLMGTKVEPWVWEALKPPALNRRLFPQILDERKMLDGEAERTKDIRAVIAFFLYQKQALKFFKRLLYPGICWLNIYPDDPSSGSFMTRVNSFLRGVRLLLYITLQLTICLIRSFLPEDGG
jgi:hypothetical protein